VGLLKLQRLFSFRDLPNGVGALVMAHALGYLQGSDVIYELEDSETQIGRADTNDIVRINLYPLAPLLQFHQAG
jgi:hypothetical protein